MMGKYRVYRLDGVGRISGVEWLDALDDRFALEGARAIANADDYVSQPAGNSGAKIACAVIGPPAK